MKKKAINFESISCKFVVSWKQVACRSVGVLHLSLPAKWDIYDTLKIAAEITHIGAKNQNNLRKRSNNEFKSKGRNVLQTESV